MKSQWLLLFPAALLGCVFGVLLARWENLPSEFFEYNFIEVVNILVALTLGYWVTYHINRRVGNESKLRDVVSSQIDNYEKRIVTLYERAEEYSRSPAPNASKQILADFKVSGGMLGNLCTAKDQCSNRVSTDVTNDKLKNDFYEYKAAITDDFLTAQGDEALKAHFGAIEEKRSKVINTLIELRINLYS